MTRIVLLILLLSASLSFSQKKKVFQDVQSIVKETQKVITVKEGEK